MKAKWSLLLTSLFLSVSVSANDNLKYCGGKVVDIITRDADEATHVRLRLSSENGGGITGYARIGDEKGYNDYQTVQVSMLLAAFMAGKSVTLELLTPGYEFNSCADFQRGLPVRNVRLQQ